MYLMLQFMFPFLLLANESEGASGSANNLQNVQNLQRDCGESRRLKSAAREYIHTLHHPKSREQLFFEFTSRFVESIVNGLSHRFVAVKDGWRQIRAEGMDCCAGLLDEECLVLV